MCALGAVLVYFGMAWACLALAQIDASLASVWLPNACMVAMFLLAKPSNEAPAYGAILLGSIGACAMLNTSIEIALLLSLANLVEIALVTWLVRRGCGDQPDMTDLSDLGLLLQHGGVTGPAVSAMIAAVAGTMIPEPWPGPLKWFLGNSMGMVLIVPAALLSAKALREKIRLPVGEMAERAALMAGGLLAVFLVFRQDIYPLLFLVPPITLLMAFRLGGLGTALYVPCVAIVASWMSFNGIGPIAQYTSSPFLQMYLIEAFVAANFLTGLPIAAILCGRLRLTEELTAGRGQLSLLTESITDAVLRIDHNLVCTYASPSVSEVLGLRPDQVVGHPIGKKMHASADHRIGAVFDRLLGGESAKERVTYRRRVDDENGSPVFIEADCAVVIDTATGKRNGIVVSARNVTDRVELELLLTRERSKAENAANAKSEFLANMSHEIRTPMNGVLGFAELVLQGELDGQSRHHIEMIVQSGRSMMLLLNDILDLSKIEAGQVAINREPVDLYATIAECAALHRPTAEKKSLALSFNPAGAKASGSHEDQGDERNPWVMTDGLRLRQIILNLVGNAVKFTEEGEVEIICSSDEFEFAIEVRDTGIGISPGRLENIFAPFTQGESDIARRFGGTGLGLTISRQLAELLGGNITVKSKAGQGSSFCLTIPAIHAEPAPYEETDDQIPIQPEDRAEPSNVLLVEDHDVNRILGTEMLERCGQNVATAHDGNEAIAMVIDSIMRDTPFDLVLMDIQMPGCDGYAATRAIRAEGIGPDTLPIIALTANAFPEDISTAREAGMQGHLAKPLVFDDLARALQRWLPTRIIEAHSGDTGSGDMQISSLVDTSRPHGSKRSMRGPEDDADARASDTAPPSPSSTYSPALMKRWTKRRSETIEAVRGALENGSLSDDIKSGESTDTLARLVHKLAGTAAIFGEPELGDQAAALERALRMRLPCDVREALAFELLSVADDPADTFVPTSG